MNCRRHLRLFNCVVWSLLCCKLLATHKLVHLLSKVALTIGLFHFAFFALRFFVDSLLRSDAVAVFRCRPKKQAHLFSRSCWICLYSLYVVVAFVVNNLWSFLFSAYKDENVNRSQCTASNFYIRLNVGVAAELSKYRWTKKMQFRFEFYKHSLCVTWDFLYAGKASIICRVRWKNCK